MSLEGIYEKIVEKGWMPYTARDDERFETIISNGPINKLESGLQYLMLPSLSNPKSISEVKSALRDMRINNNYPVIKYDGIFIPISLFSVENDKILLRGQRDFKLFYPEFERALDTLVSRKVLLNSFR